MDRSLQRRLQKTNYQHIKRLCRDRGQLFEDVDFQPVARSLYKNKKPGFHPIVWLRPHVSKILISVTYTCVDIMIIFLNEIFWNDFLFLFVGNLPTSKVHSRRSNPLWCRAGGSRRSLVISSRIKFNVDSKILRSCCSSWSKLWAWLLRSVQVGDRPSEL